MNDKILVLVDSDGNIIPSIITYSGHARNNETTDIVFALTDREHINKFDRITIPLNKRTRSLIQKKLGVEESYIEKVPDGYIVREFNQEFFGRRNIKYITTGADHVLCTWNSESEHYTWYDEFGGKL